MESSGSSSVVIRNSRINLKQNKVQAATALTYRISHIELTCAVELIKVSRRYSTISDSGQSLAPLYEQRWESHGKPILCLFSPVVHLAPGFTTTLVRFVVLNVI